MVFEFRHDNEKPHCIHYAANCLQYTRKLQISAKPHVWYLDKVFQAEIISAFYLNRSC